MTPDQSEAVNLEATPGIGRLGESAIQQYGTRVVHVCGEVVSTLEELEEIADAIIGLQAVDGVSCEAVSRRMVKAVVDFPIQAGSFGTAAMKVEASIPIDDRHFWIEAGLNSGTRAGGKDIIDTQRNWLKKTAEDQKHAPQTGEQILNYAKESNPQIVSAELIVITPDNLKEYQEELQALFDQAFTAYLGSSPLKEIEAICGSNLVLAAVGTDNQGQRQILATTAIECLAAIGGITVGEIGCSASQAKGVGSLAKRALIELLLKKRKYPNLAITESRISRVLGANMRAGLVMNPNYILPHHSHIGSKKDPVIGGSLDLTGLGGEGFEVESMTMTWANRAQAQEIINIYGGIPIQERNDRLILWEN